MNSCQASGLFYKIIKETLLSVKQFKYDNFLHLFLSWKHSLTNNLKIIDNVITVLAIEKSVMRNAFSHRLVIP